MIPLHWEIAIRREIDFASLDKLQDEFIQNVKKDPNRAYLLISEPQATFTHGRFAGRQDLLWSDSELERQGIAIHAASRGGKWTYHGPGQIVIYPIVQVRRLGYDRRAVFQLMNDLRASVKRALEAMGLSPRLNDRPFGIYVHDQKIASFGMALHDGISSNGVAIYADHQSNQFLGINPCGVPNEKVTSLREAGCTQEWEIMALVLAEHVKKGFKTH